MRLFCGLQIFTKAKRMRTNLDKQPDILKRSTRNILEGLTKQQQDQSSHHHPIQAT